MKHAIGTELETVENEHEHQINLSVVSENGATVTVLDMAGSLIGEADATRPLIIANTSKDWSKIQVQSDMDKTEIEIE